MACNDVLFKTDHVVIKIRKSKTDQYRFGDEIVLAKLASVACPVKWLLRYYEISQIDAKSDHYLFKPMYRAKSGVGRINQNRTKN